MKSEKEIIRVQKKIRPVFTALRKDLSSVQQDLANILDKDMSEILVQYNRAKTDDEKKRLRKGYTRAVQIVIASEAYKAAESGILETIRNADTEAMDIIEDEKYGVYAVNYNRIGNGLKRDLNDYDFKAISEEDAHVADLTDRKLNSGKLNKWNRSSMRNTMKARTAAMISPKAVIAYTVGRLIKNNLRMCDGQAEGMVVDARTLGELDSMHRADDEGYDILKVWLAVMDNRTRESHADLDGTSIPLNEKFDNGLERPRDPSGALDEVINCRCDLGYDTGGRKNRTRAAREGKVTGSYKKSESFRGTKTVTVDNMTYREWQRWRK